MTQEQDIIERLLSLPTPLSDAEYRSLGEEAAQTIAALRAERDKTKAELERRTANPADYRYWEGRWRDTQAECDTAIRERDEWKAEAESLGDSREQMRCKKKAAEAERDEARKALKNARDWALEEAANTIDDMQCIGPCYAHYDNMSQTIRDLRRASLASSNREGGEE